MSESTIPFPRAHEGPRRPSRLTVVKDDEHGTITHSTHRHAPVGGSDNSGSTETGPTGRRAGSSAQAGPSLAMSADPDRDLPSDRIIRTTCIRCGGSISHGDPDAADTCSACIAESVGVPLDRECRWCGSREPAKHRAFCDDARGRNMPYRTPLPQDDWQFEHCVTAKLPTPPEQYSDAMVASILDRIGVELAGLSANLRKLAPTFAPKDAA